TNLIGVRVLASEIGSEQCGLLHQLVPGAERIAVLVDPSWPITERFVQDVRAAAAGIGKQVDIFSASTSSDIEAVFQRFAQKAADALLVGPSALANNRRVQLVTLTAYHRMPAIYAFRESADVGGLMSYGASIADAHRQVGIYVGRVLKGTKPSDLPVMQSAKFEFVINLNT